MTLAVVLYGPPASGKDTVTAELSALDKRYVPYRRLKVGSGRAHGYRIVTATEFRELERAGEVLYRNSRYGNVYGVDRPSLMSLTDDGGIPVVHVGQVDAFDAIEAFPAVWVRVLLWCPRDVTAQRSAMRGDTDASARLAAWDETRRDLDQHPEVWFDLAVRTDHVAAGDAAQAIHAVVIHGSPGRTKSSRAVATA